MRRYGNNFHSWLRYSLKALPNRLTRDKIVIHTSILYVFALPLCWFICTWLAMKLQFPPLHHHPHGISMKHYFYYTMKLWNYLFIIPTLERLHRRHLGMDKLFHCTLDKSWNYLSLMGLKLIHVSKMCWCLGVRYLYSAVRMQILQNTFICNIYSFLIPFSSSNGFA